MSYDYSTLQATALRLIDRFGAAAVLTRSNHSSSNIDPVTGAVTSHTPSTGNFKAVTVPASKGTMESFDNRIIGMSAQIGKLFKFFIATPNGTILVPSGQGDTLTFDSTVYKILGCTPVAPAGSSSIIVYRIGCAV